nr:MAG TPA: hypothetical protein [Caudoviricetes sp.]
MISTPNDPKEPFDFHKAAIVLLTILTVIYTVRGILWLVTH